MRYIECHECGALVRVPDSLIEARMPTPVVRVYTSAHAQPRTFRPEGMETKRSPGLQSLHDVVLADPERRARYEAKLSELCHDGCDSGDCGCSDK